MTYLNLAILRKFKQSGVIILLGNTGGKKGSHSKIMAITHMTYVDLRTKKTLPTRKNSNFSSGKLTLSKNYPDLDLVGNVVNVENGHQSQMANGHLGLGSNVQLGLVDFKASDWPPETSLNGQSQTLKSCWPIKTSLSWLITKL